MKLRSRVLPLCWRNPVTMNNRLLFLHYQPRNKLELALHLPAHQGWLYRRVLKSFPGSLFSASILMQPPENLFNTLNATFRRSVFVAF